MKKFCTQQIKSYNGSVYAEQNDEVQVISINGHVAIVEGKKGRFPVLVEFLSDEAVFIPEPEPVALRAPKSADKDQLNIFDL